MVRDLSLCWDGKLEENWIKLNTEGASIVDMRAGCGGIIHDNKRECQEDFYKGVGLCSAFRAELWGVFQSLSLFRRLGSRKVELSVNSILIVKSLKSEI